MKTILLAVLLFSTVAIAEEADQAQPLVINEVAGQPPPQQSMIKRKPLVLKKAQPAITKGASYLLSWTDNGEQFEEEVIATGRTVSDCNGTRYEVYNDDFSYFASLKQLLRIRSCR